MGHKFSVLRKIRFLYYKKLKQHVFIDGQLINKQRSGKGLCNKRTAFTNAIID